MIFGALGALVSRYDCLAGLARPMGARTTVTAWATGPGPVFFNARIVSYCWLARPLATFYPIKPYSDLSGLDY